MNAELKHVSPIRAANVMAILYAVMMLLFSIPMLGFILLIPTTQGQDAAETDAAFSMFRWMMLGYPIFGAVFGWFGGLTSAWIYNLIAARLGGLKLRFSVDAEVDSSHAA